VETPDLFNEQRQLAEYHYQAALAAAKGMIGTRQKVRTCREICDHLRQMLEASETDRTDRSPRTGVALEIVGRDVSL
jgi:hypothetical protein